MKKRCTAILLAAGAGRRMESKVAKQYMLLKDKPVIWYGLQAFEQSSIIDDVILVVGKGEVSYVQEEIVKKYGFSKVDTITEGGAERYLSVQKALAVIAEEEMRIPNRDGYLFIHDGARPLVTEKIIEDTYHAAERYGACCAAMPVKDTIKLADENGFAEKTPDRSRMYAVQTPQVFSTPLILEAYGLLFKHREELEKQGVKITDDAMVVEHMLHHPVKLVEASYENIKITTPEDLEVAVRFLERR
ncbi:MAG: 2-C-methyl-D-erythritol 4-phosphate cytidylyltransferase [Lachnospiraceae bacterium]